MNKMLEPCLLSVAPGMGWRLGLELHSRWAAMRLGGQCSWLTWDEQAGCSETDMLSMKMFQSDSICYAQTGFLLRGQFLCKVTFGHIMPVEMSPAACKSIYD